MFINLNEINLVEKIYIFSTLMTCAGSIFLGLYVYVKNRYLEVNRIYFVMSLTLAVWSLLLFFCHISASKEAAIFWNRFLHLAAIFIPITVLHFMISLLGIYNEKRKIVELGYIFCLLLTPFVFTPLFIKDMAPRFYFRAWPVPGPVYPVFLFLFFVYLAYAWILVFKGYRNSCGVRRNQLKYILIGLTAGLVGGSTNYGYFYNIPIVPLGNFFVFSYVVIYAFAIIKHRLLDLEIVIARSFILLSVYSFVLLVAAWLVYPMRPYLHILFGAKWYLAPVIAFAALSMFAPFAYLYYQQRYDQRRLKRQRAQLAKLKQITATSIDVDHEQLLKNIPAFLMQMYREDFQTDVDYMAVYLYEKNQDSYRLVSSKTKRADISLETSVLKTDPIPGWFIEKAPYFVKHCGLDEKYLESVKFDDLDYYLSKQADRELIGAMTNLKNNMKQFKADICIACFYKDRFLAFLLMGKKQKGAYGQEELDTFSLLAHDVAATIRSAELRDELEQSYIDAIHAIITALEERDAYTKGHSERVVKYSVMIAEELKDAFPFSRIFNFIDKVKRAALLHDVGKIGVPDSILLKSGKLTDQEYSKLKEHPRTSLHIVQSIKNLSEDIREGIESHHERYDGKGYGRGVKGHRVPPIARIIAVADTFDAMTSNRPYRKAMTEKITVKEIIDASGAQFDPKVVEAFNKVYEKGKLKK